jgi:serine/threonine protein kinase
VQAAIFVLLLVTFGECPFSSLLSATEHGAIHRANAIWNVDNNFGLTQGQLIDICKYIETIQSKKVKGRKLYTSQKTGLPCLIEKLPSSKGFFIKNLPQSHTRVGRGAHKRVNKCIFYSRHPKIVVSCSGDQTIKREIYILKKLKGCRGITSFMGSSCQGDNCSMYLDYFSEGSLGAKLDRNYPFTEKQILHLAKDLVMGIQALHKHHIVHRDLHEYNIVLRSKGGELFEGAITDFGTAKETKTIKRNKIPFVAQYLYPPELLLHPYSNATILSNDLYGLGCCFYRLIWKSRVPWFNAYHKKLLESSDSKKKRDVFKSVASLYKQTKQNTIGHILRKKQSGTHLTPYEEFQIIVFSMIHFNPNQRPKHQKLCDRVTQLVSQMENQAKKH